MMASPSNDDRTFTFLRLFKEHEHLWNTDHAKFEDLNERIQSLALIATEMQFQNGVQEVETKIQALRNTYETACCNGSSNSSDLTHIKWFPLMKSIFERKVPDAIEATETTDKKKLKRPKRRARRRKQPRYYTTIQKQKKTRPNDPDWSSVNQIVQGIIDDWDSGNAAIKESLHVNVKPVQATNQSEKRNLRPYKPPKYCLHPERKASRRTVGARLKTDQLKDERTINTSVTDVNDKPPPVLTKQEVICITDNSDTETMSFCEMSDENVMPVLTNLASNDENYNDLKTGSKEISIPSTGLYDDFEEMESPIKEYVIVKDGTNIATLERNYVQHVGDHLYSSNCDVNSQDVLQLHQQAERDRQNQDEAEEEEEDPMDAFAQIIREKLRKMSTDHIVNAQKDILQLLQNYESNGALRCQNSDVQNGTVSVQDQETQVTEDIAAPQIENVVLSSSVESTADVQGLQASISSLMEIITTKHNAQPLELTNINYSFGRTVSLMLEEFENSQQQSKRRRIMSVLVDEGLN